MLTNIVQMNIFVEMFLTAVLTLSHVLGSYAYLYFVEEKSRYCDQCTSMFLSSGLSRHKPYCGPVTSKTKEVIVAP